MRRFVLLLLTLTAAGCGTQVDPKSSQFLYKGTKDLPPAYRDPDIEHTLNEFMADAMSSGFNPWPEEKQLRVLAFQDGLVDGNMPPVKGTSAEGHAPIGICVTAREVNPMNRKTIFMHHFVYLDASLKSIVGTPYFKAVAYHEFFHCLFGGKHSERPDFKSIKSPLERLRERITNSADGKPQTLSQVERNELLKEAEHEYFDDLSASYGIMSPQLIFDQNFWDYKWTDLVEKLFTTHE